MALARLDEFINVYRDGLLKDSIPFWIRHSIDREDGGYLFCLDRDGTVIDTDKSVWLTGRFIWTLSTLYNTVEKKQEWLDLAAHGLDFLRKHAFDKDGRMFFLLAKDGTPLRKRRYLFSEAFAIIGLAAFAKATNDPKVAQEAVDLFKLLLRYHTTAGLLEPKWNPEARAMRGLVMPMIITATAQELRQVTDDPICDEWINKSIEDIERYHVREDMKCVLETVGANGEFLDHFDGRMLNPGHAIEGGWFILHESRVRGNDPKLTELGCKMIDWSFERGWDQEYGGIFYFRDAKNLPSTEYWHDMKFWWPHNEAAIGMLLAYHLTGDDKYAKWHEMVHDWMMKHFPDREHGEWYGYLHRDGSVSSRLKGNVWKGPFHLPRMHWYCWQLLEEMKAKG